MRRGFDGSPEVFLVIALLHCLDRARVDHEPHARVLAQDDVPGPTVLIGDDEGHRLRGAKLLGAMACAIRGDEARVPEVAPERHELSFAAADDHTGSELTAEDNAVPARVHHELASNFTGRRVATAPVVVMDDGLLRVGEIDARHGHALEHSSATRLRVAQQQFVESVALYVQRGTLEPEVSKGELMNPLLPDGDSSRLLQKPCRPDLLRGADDVRELPEVGNEAFADGVS